MQVWCRFSSNTVQKNDKLTWCGGRGGYLMVVLFLSFEHVSVGNQIVRATSYSTNRVEKKRREFREGCRSVQNARFEATRALFAPSNASIRFEKVSFWLRLAEGVK